MHVILTFANNEEFLVLYLPHGDIIIIYKCNCVYFETFHLCSSVRWAILYNVLVEYVTDNYTDT